MTRPFSHPVLFSRTYHFITYGGPAESKQPQYHRRSAFFQDFNYSFPCCVAHTFRFLFGLGQSMSLVRRAGRSGPTLPPTLHTTTYLCSDASLFHFLSLPRKEKLKKATETVEKPIQPLAGHVTSRWDYVPWMDG